VSRLRYSRMSQWQTLKSSSQLNGQLHEQLTCSSWSELSAPPQRKFSTVHRFTVAPQPMSTVIYLWVGFPVEEDAPCGDINANE
jgi:hypothetical protein